MKLSELIEVMAKAGLTDFDVGVAYSLAKLLGVSVEDDL